jgi:hypothetical protein
MGGRRGQQKCRRHNAQAMPFGCQAEYPFQPLQYRAAALTFGKPRQTAADGLVPA